MTNSVGITRVTYRCAANLCTTSVLRVHAANRSRCRTDWHALQRHSLRFHTGTLGSLDFRWNASSEDLDEHEVKSSQVRVRSNQILAVEDLELCLPPRRTEVCLCLCCITCTVENSHIFTYRFQYTWIQAIALNLEFLTQVCSCKCIRASV